MNIDLGKITEREFLSKYLEFTNLSLPKEKRLVPMEIDLVVEFALLPNEKFQYQRFSSLAKSKVIEAAAAKNWKLTKLNINNKLYSLVEKGFLRRDEDGVLYLPKYLLTALSLFREQKTYKFSISYARKES